MTIDILSINDVDITDIFVEYQNNRVAATAAAEYAETLANQQRSDVTVPHDADEFMYDLNKILWGTVVKTAYCPDHKEFSETIALPQVLRLDGSGVALMPFERERFPDNVDFTGAAKILYGDLALGNAFRTLLDMSKKANVDLTLTLHSSKGAYPQDFREAFTKAHAAGPQVFDHVEVRVNLLKPYTPKYELA